MKNSFEQAKKQNQEDFKRDTGVSLDNFFTIINLVKDYFNNYYAKNPNRSKGQKPSIIIEDKILLTLYYLRHYPTFVNLGNVFNISESYANKIYHSILTVLVQELHVPGSKTLMDTDLDTIVIYVSEQEIERPVKKQNDYYSGKKKKHTIKIQLVICLFTMQIICIRAEKGKVHDFRIFKESLYYIHPDLLILIDSGYQGIKDIHGNSWIPAKKTKKKPLTKEKKKDNKELSQLRIYVENVNRRCKIFRATKETYRGKHKNYGKVWNVVAGLVNLRYAA